MLFSMIVPVYNVEKYLPECLDSIENQRFQDFELILIDDGSTDRSGTICDRYAENHNNTVVIHKKNEGLVLTRRRGIREAKGEYITFCDSDDYISQNMLEELQKIIAEKHPDMVMFGYNIVDDDHTVYEECYHVFPDGTEFDDRNREELLYRFATSVWLNSMDTKATRRELFDRDQDYSDFKKIKMGEDQMQVIPLLRNSRSFYYCEKPLCYYRNNPGGISKNLTAEFLNDYLRISEQIYTFLKDEQVSQQTMTAYFNRYLMDVYKYLLKYCRAGMGRDEYLKRYQQITDHRIYRLAKNEKEKWSQGNRILSWVAGPHTYHLATLLSKTALSAKLKL